MSALSSELSPETGPLRCEAGCGSLGPLLREDDGTCVCSTCYAERSMDRDVATVKAAVDDTARIVEAADREAALAKQVVDDFDRICKEAGL